MFCLRRQGLLQVKKKRAFFSFYKLTEWTPGSGWKEG